MKVIENLSRSVSKYQHIQYLDGPIQRECILQSLSTNGYCFYRNTNLNHDLFSDNDSIMTSTTQYVQQSLFGENYLDQLMNYSIGTDARDKHRNSSLLSVSKISSKHWVPYHNELLYTHEFPKIIAFICMKAPECEGYTPFANTIDAYHSLPAQMREKFNKFGITYIRNLRDKTAEQSIPDNPLDLGGQKFMQDIFNTNDRKEIEFLCDLNGYHYEWNLCALNKTPILRIRYVAPAIVEYAFNGDIVRSFANSVTGMNGRYFENYNAYYESLMYIDRPFHSQWGNGDEFSDEEYSIIEQCQIGNSIRFQWEDGDIFVADNLCWAHGRYPYEGDRNILVIMGEPYQRYPFMIHQKPMKHQANL